MGDGLGGTSWQDQTWGSGLSGWRAGGGLGEQGHTVYLEAVGGLPLEWGWRTSPEAQGLLLVSGERCSPALPLNAETWGLHRQSQPGMFDTGLEGSSSSAGIWLFGGQRPGTFGDDAF